MPFFHHFSLPRIFLRINFETPVPYSTSYETGKIYILTKKIKFILDLFPPKFYHFPSDYFHESISRPILSLFHPCFLSRNKVYTQTYTRFNRSNGTRSLDLHKAWAYPFPGVSWKDSVLRRDAPGRGEQCGWECVYRCTCPSRFDVTLMCNFRPRAPPTTVFALTYKRARSQRVLGLPQWKYRPFPAAVTSVSIIFSPFSSFSLPPLYFVHANSFQPWLDVEYFQRRRRRRNGETFHDYTVGG